MFFFYILSFIFILIFTKGGLIQIGMPQIFLKLLLIALIFLLFINTFFRKNFYIVPGTLLFCAYILLCFISGIISGDGITASFLYCRHTIFAFIVFWSVWGICLSETHIYKLIKLLIYLITLQILASIFNIYYFGQKEYRVGLMFFGGGSQATVFTLIPMGIGLAFYYYYNKLWILLLSLLFFLVGLASGKRAIFFICPPFILLSMIMFIFVEKRRCNYFVILKPCLLLFSMIPVFFYMLSTTSMFQDIQEIDGMEKRFEIMWDRASTYSLGNINGAGTSGRASSTILLWEIISKNSNTETLLFGMGPTALTEKGGKHAMTKYGLFYGISGWGVDLLSVGLPVSLIFILFYFYFWYLLFAKSAKKFKKFWKTTHLGVIMFFFCFCIIHLYYSAVFFADSTASIVLFFLLALLLSPNYKFILLNKNRQIYLDFVVRS